MMNMEVISSCSYNVLSIYLARTFSRPIVRGHGFESQLTKLLLFLIYYIFFSAIYIFFIYIFYFIYFYKVSRIIRICRSFC